MVFGYTLAVIVGFLFTAGRNWSGQPTPTGRALMSLAALWLAARVLLFTPWAVAAALANVAFPLAAAFGLGRALVAGGNRRNSIFIGLLVALAAVQALVHAALAGAAVPSSTAGLQLGLDLVLFIMSVMGGRVIPMFTNNGVPGTQATRHPVVEKLALGCVLALLAADLLQVPWNKRLAALAHFRDRLTGSRGTPLDFGELAQHQGSPAERALLRRQDYVVPVSPGPRILRADTAAIAALALWQAAAGDWRPAGTP